MQNTKGKYNENTKGKYNENTKGKYKGKIQRENTKGK